MKIRVESEKREHEIKVRVTESEWSLIKKNSENARVAQWIRELVLANIQGNQKIKKRRKIEKVTIDPFVLRQLVGIGNNLNQLARHANAKGELPSLVALISVKNEFQQIREKLSDS